MADSSDDDDLFCSPRTTKKAKPPPKKKAKTTSILDQVMAADAKTEARVNQLKEMNAASRKDLGEQAPSTGVSIDWDYIRRKPGSIAARAEAAVRAVDERPGGDSGVEVVLGCSTVRRVRVPDAERAAKLLSDARDGLSTEGELARAFASLIHDDASKKTPAARNALLEALGGRYAARHPDDVPQSLTRWLHLTAALDARPAVARGALETLVEMDQRSLDEGIVDDVLALYISEEDVPKDEDACRRLDRALRAWSASFGHGGLSNEALQRVAERCIDLAHDENVATSSGGAAAARRCVESALAALADAGGNIDAGDPCSSRDAAQKCISILRALPPPTSDLRRAAIQGCCLVVFAATLKEKAPAADVSMVEAYAAALRAVPGGDPPLGAHATLYALLCAVAALHAVCGDAAGDAHDAVANAAEALRKRVVSLDPTAAHNAEFLDTLIATCHLDRDARARKGLVQRTIDAAVVAPPPPEASPPGAVE